MRTSFFLVLSLITSVATGSAVELTPAATEAFDKYVALFEARRLHQAPFLLGDTPQHQDQLRNGGVIVFPGKDKGEEQVQFGLIHDWVGTIFVPGITLEKALSVIQDYAHQSTTYAPDIADSRLRSHQGNEDFEVYIRLVKSKFMMSDVLDTEHKIHFTYVGPDKAYCKSYSTRIAEVSDPGTKKEHELPVGKDRGFLWRMYGYWFFEQKDGGVYVEYESISLSRDVPMLMSKVLGPVLHSLPAESLRTSMEKTRKALASSTGHTPS